MRDDKFMASVFDDMTDEEMEAFCNALQCEVEVENSLNEKGTNSHE